ncbi:MAG: hypothetical protein JO287_27230 [Pseudonocardiales bacterium]|nr:hypothetical protein [Pseudonocardiales bacterium]
MTSADNGNNPDYDDHSAAELSFRWRSSTLIARTAMAARIAVVDQAEGFSFESKRSGQSSKHIPFDWSGPDQP